MDFCCIYIMGRKTDGVYGLSSDLCMTGDFREIRMMQENDQNIFNGYTSAGISMLRDTGISEVRRLTVENADGSIEMRSSIPGIIRFLMENIICKGLPAVYASDRGSPDTGTSIMEDPGDRSYR